MILEKRLSMRFLDILIALALALLGVRLLRLEREHSGLTSAWEYSVESEREARQADYDRLSGLRGDVAGLKDALVRQGIKL